MPRHVVAREGEIPDGGRKIVEVDGRSIGIFRVAGDYYALLNRCPHQAAPLCEGRLWSGMTVSDRPGAYANRADVPIVSCIWHGWEFDLRTGQSLCEPQRLRVRTYDVFLEGEMDGQSEAGHEAVAPEQSLVATTFPVESDGQWIVIDVDRRPAISGTPRRDR